MSWLDRITPTNLLEEKAKFFDDPTYNPQFVYDEPVELESLTKYGSPLPEYLELAREILDRAYFGRNERDLLMMEGRKQNQEEVTRRIQTFLQMHHLEKRFQIIWSPTYVSRATITEDTLKLRTTADYHEEGLIGLIYHEIGTHGLRRLNYEKQPWFKKKKKFGLNPTYLRTEEGLAVLHALIPHTYKSAYTSAIRYVAIDYAQSHSLAELWNFLGRYIQDPETRWMVTFRQKRGLSDTSQGRATTKDLVYFEGMIKVWHWLKNNDFNLTPLYYGKISYKDADKVVALNPDFRPLLPSFYTLDPDEYAQNILDIGIENKLEELKNVA